MRSRGLLWLVAVAASTSIAVAALPATAQTPARDPVAAEALFRAARDDMNAGNLDVACPRFEESYRLDPTPGTLFNVAICFEKAGKIASAWQRWQQAMDAVGEGDRRFAEAQRHRDDLAGQLPKLVVTLAPGVPDDAVLSKDGAVFGRASLGLPIPIDPGPHELVVRLGGAEKRFQVVGANGETRSVELDAPAAPVGAPAPPPTRPATPPPQGDDEEPRGSSAQSTVGWIVLAGGGLGLALFGVTGALVVAADGTATDNCASTCNADGQAAVSRGDALLLPNAIGLVAGVALAGAGVTLILTDPGEEPPASATLNVGPRGVTASGRF